MQRKIHFIILSLIAILAFVIFGISMFGVSASSADLSSVTYNETYNLGDEFIVQDAKFLYGGQEYTAKGIINYPSGKRISSKSVLLTESGKHSIEYVAEINGKIISEKQYFTVLDNVYSIDGSGEINFGKNSYFSDVGDVDGLNVALGKESTFKFNKIIDVTNLTRYDTVMQWYNTPNVIGSYDVRKVYFRLTDIYDSENYIEMQYKYSPDNGFSATYIVANANGQLPSGLHYRDKGPSATSYEYNGYHYTLYQNNRHFGYYAEVSFDGQILAWKKDFSENCMRFAIDYQEKALYCTPAYGNNLDRCVVIDLDDERFFGENLWKGFTTGEALLSLYAEQYSTSQYNFFITDIYGHDIGNLYSANQIAPNITLDLLDYEEHDLPKAVVGKEYKIFSAKVLDDSENDLDYEVFVYYNYNNSSRAQLNVVDGKFKPLRAGEYTIVYRAQDSFANVSEKYFTVTAVEKDKIDYSFSQNQTVFDAGDVVNVALPTIINPEEKYQLDIVAILKDSDVVYEVDDETLTFVPLYAGDYVIEYRYSDYVFSDTFSYDITVNSTNTVKFIKEPSLPRYIIKDCEYVFDAGKAYSFDNGTKTVIPEIYVRTDGVNKTKMQNYTYTLTENVSSVDLIYTAGNTEKVYTLPVVDVGYGQTGKLKLANYLQGDKFTSVSNRYGTTYTTDDTKSSDGNATLSLINPAQLIRDFQIAFVGVTDKSNFDSVTISFTSVDNVLDVINFTYEKQTDLSAIVTVTRGDYVVNAPTLSEFCSDENKSFGMVYANNEIIIANSNLKIPYQTLFKDFGNEFYIDFSFSGVVGESAIYIKKIVDQDINNSAYDIVKPTLIYDDFATAYELGDVVHFGKVSVYDFVDKNAKVAFSASVDSQFVIATDGTVLDGVSNKTDKEYDYVWNTYEDLNVEIQAYDYSGQSVYEYPILVMLDVTNPTITLGKAQLKCALGDTVKVAPCEVSDDRDGVSYSIVVICPNGKTFIVKEGKFKADCLGTYTISYMATDLAGNVEFAFYNVFCE